MKKLILIIGPSDHIFSRTLVAMAADKKCGVEAEICPDSKLIPESLANRLPDSIIIINQTEKEALTIAKTQKKSQVILMHGGEKDFQPRLTLIRPDGNHKRLSFDSWEDWLEKIKDFPIDPRPILSATDTSNLYRLNYRNLPTLKKKWQAKLNPDFFWFSVFFSKTYLSWLNQWLKEVTKKSFPFQSNLSAKGKIRRLAIPFDNVYKGQAIFAEGDAIIFTENPIKNKEDEIISREDYLSSENADEENGNFESDDGNEVLKTRERFLSGTIVACDEESLDIVFAKRIPKDSLRRFNWFNKDPGIAQANADAYTGHCRGYADLSRNDYIYTTTDHFDRPEDFLRGYTANLSPLHLPINTVLLDGPSQVIQYDRGQLEALVEMLGPSFLSLIKGGPGTGKTLLTAVAVKQFLRQGRIVFLSSASNKALASMLEELTKHVAPEQIFLLGNNTELIASHKVTKLHRRYRYEKQIAKAKAKYETEMEKTKIKKSNQVRFNEEDFAVECETEEIWARLCEGKTIVLASTLNSFLFDHTLIRLRWQKDAIHSVNFQNVKAEGEGSVFIPKAIKNYMDGDNKKCRPIFQLDVTIVDEATKLRLPEIIPLMKNTVSKLILIGDLDQLGNVPINSEANIEIMKLVEEQSQLLQIDRKNVETEPESFSRKVIKLSDKGARKKLAEIIPEPESEVSELNILGPETELAIFPDDETDQKIMWLLRERCVFVAQSGGSVFFSLIEDRYRSGNVIRITPSRINEDDHALSPLETTWGEVKKWLSCFSEGVFYSLIKEGGLTISELEVNRRSLPEIVRFLNEVFGKKMTVGRFHPTQTGSICFLNVRGKEERIKTSYRNRKEKCVMVNEIIKFFHRQKKRSGATDLLSLGGITTYRGQLGLTRERLRKELLYHQIFGGMVTPENVDGFLRDLINTVDAFQGSERDTIIVSLVRSNKEGRLGFSVDLRRIYVAMSRARNNLIIIGDAGTFLQSKDEKIREIFQRLIEFTKKRGTFINK